MLPALARSVGPRAPVKSMGKFSLPPLKRATDENTLPGEEDQPQDVPEAPGAAPPQLPPATWQNVNVPGMGAQLAPFQAQESADRAALLAKGQAIGTQQYNLQQAQTRQNAYEEEPAFDQAGVPFRKLPGGGVEPRVNSDQYVQGMLQQQLGTEAKTADIESRYQPVDQNGDPSTPQKIAKLTAQKEAEVRGNISQILSDKAQEKEGGIAGFLTSPTASATLAVQRKAEIDGGADLTDQDKALLAQSANPDHGQSLDDLNALQDQQDKLSQAQSAKQTAADLKLRMADPNAWMAQHQQENQSLDLDGLESKIQTLAPDIAQRTQQLQQAQQAIAAKDQQFDQNAQQLAAQNQQDTQGPMLPGQFQTGPDGTVWTKQNAAAMSENEHQRRLFTLNTLKDRGMIEAQGIRLQQDTAVLADAHDQWTQKKAQDEADTRQQLRANPLTGPLANDLDANDKQYQTDVAHAQSAYSDPDQQQAAMQAAQQSYQDRTKVALAAHDVRNKATQQAVASLKGQPITPESIHAAAAQFGAPPDGVAAVIANMPGSPRAQDALQSALLAAKMEVAPSIGMAAGGLAGAQAGAELGSAAGPWGVAIGGIGGAIVGSGVVGAGVKWLQNKIMGDKAVNETQAQMAANQAEHPYASMAGSAGPQFVSMLASGGPWVKVGQAIEARATARATEELIAQGFTQDAAKAVAANVGDSEAKSYLSQIAAKLGQASTEKFKGSLTGKFAGGLTGALEMGGRLGAGEEGQKEADQGEFNPLHIVGAGLESAAKMSPLALLPEAKGFLATIGWKAGADAAALGLSNMAYNAAFKGEPIDAEKFKQQFGVDMPSFMLLNGVNFLLHNRGFSANVHQPFQPDTRAMDVGASQAELSKAAQDPATSALVTRAQSMRDIAQGQFDPATAPDDQLKALGVNRDLTPAEIPKEQVTAKKAALAAAEKTGDPHQIAQATQDLQDVSNVSRPAVEPDEHGNPILLQPAIDEVRQAFPVTGRTIGMDESDARAHFQQKAAEAEEDKNANVPQPQGDTVPASQTAPEAQQPTEAQASNPVVGSGPAVDQARGNQKPATVGDRDSVEQANLDRLKELDEAHAQGLLNPEEQKEHAALKDWNSERDAAAAGSYGTPSGARPKIIDQLSPSDFTGKEGDAHRQNVIDGMADRPLPERKKAKAVLDAVKGAVKTYGGLLKGVRLQRGGGAAYVSDGHLVLDLDRLARSHGGESGGRTAIHEITHAVASGKFSESQMHDLWDNAPDDLKKLAYQAYHSHELNSGKPIPTLPPTSPAPPHKFQLAHELFRQYVESKHFRGISEAADIDPSKWTAPFARRLLDMLQSYGQRLKEMLGIASPEFRGQIESMGREVAQTMRATAEAAHRAGHITDEEFQRYAPKAEEPSLHTAVHERPAFTDHEMPFGHELFDEPAIPQNVPRGTSPEPEKSEITSEEPEETQDVPATIAREAGSDPYLQRVGTEAIAAGHKITTARNIIKAAKAGIPPERRLTVAQRAMEVLGNIKRDLASIRAVVHNPDYAAERNRLSETDLAAQRDAESRLVAKQDLWKHWEEHPDLVQEAQQPRGTAIHSAERPIPDEDRERLRDIYGEDHPSFPDILKREGRWDSSYKGAGGKLGEMARHGFKTLKGEDVGPMAADPGLRKALDLPEMTPYVSASADATQAGKDARKRWGDAAQHTMDALADNLGASRGSELREHDYDHLLRIAESTGNETTMQSMEHAVAASSVAQQRTRDFLDHPEVQQEIAYAEKESQRPGGINLDAVADRLRRLANRFNDAKYLEGRPRSRGSKDLTEISNHAIDQFIDELRNPGQERGWLNRFKTLREHERSGAGENEAISRGTVSSPAPVREPGPALPRVRDLGDLTSKIKKLGWKDDDRMTKAEAHQKIAAMEQGATNEEVLSAYKPGSKEFRDKEEALPKQGAQQETDDEGALDFGALHSAEREPEDNDTRTTADTRGEKSSPTENRPVGMFRRILARLTGSKGQFHSDNSRADIEVGDKGQVDIHEAVPKALESLPPEEAKDELAKIGAFVALEKIAPGPVYKLFRDAYPQSESMKNLFHVGFESLTNAPVLDNSRRGVQLRALTRGNDEAKEAFAKRLLRLGLEYKLTGGTSEDSRFDKNPFWKERSHAVLKQFGDAAEEGAYGPELRGLFEHSTEKLQEQIEEAQKEEPSPAPVAPRSSKTHRAFMRGFAALAGLHMLTGAAEPVKDLAGPKLREMAGEVSHFKAEQATARNLARERQEENDPLNPPQKSENALRDWSPIAEAKTELHSAERPPLETEDALKELNNLKPSEAPSQLVNPPEGKAGERITNLRNALALAKGADHRSALIDAYRREVKSIPLYNAARSDDKLQSKSISSIDKLLHGNKAPALGNSFGTPQDRVQSALTHLGTDAGASGPIKGSERIVQGKAQSRALTDWARSNGLLLHKLPKYLDLDGDDDKGGSEHHVFPSKDGARWIKITRGNGTYMGITPRSGEKEWNFGNASPKEYLQRIHDQNDVLGDDTILHGVWTDAYDQTALVTSHPDIKGDPADQKFIGEAMKRSGYKQLDPTSFYRASDNTLIADAHDQNGVKVGDKFVPFDVHVSHPAGELKYEVSAAPEWKEPPPVKGLPEAPSPPDLHAAPRPIQAAVQAGKSIAATAMKPVDFNEGKQAIGKMIDEQTAQGKQAEDLARAFMKAVPGKDRREAITLHNQALGKGGALASWAASPDRQLADRAQKAQSLTPEELKWATRVRSQTTVTSGDSEHLWEKPISPAKQDELGAKQGNWRDFGDAINEGFRPKTMDAASLYGVNKLREINQTTQKQLLTDLRSARSSDNVPLAVPMHRADWRYKPSSASPALSGLSFHREIGKNVNAIFGHSALRDWAGSPSDTIGAELAKRGVNLVSDLSTAIKSGMFSLSAFHIVAEGTHALGHGVNPLAFGTHYDPSNPDHRDAIQHGLMLGHAKTADDFLEGLSGVGWVDKIPGIGRVAKGFSEATAHYVDAMKLNTYKAVLPRNLARFDKEIASGKMSVGDVKHMTAMQVNDGYGHLNYAMMGRNPTVRHLMSLGFLAPDFLEARLRFAGSAAKGFLGQKSSREQGMAMAALGTSFYVGARVLNALLTNGDTKPDHPFGVVVGNREYSMRSVPEDVYSMIKDPGKFWNSRLSPFSSTGVQLLTGRNYRGEAQTPGEAIKEAATNALPMSVREIPGIKKFVDPNNPLSPLEGLAGAFGLHIKKASAQPDAYDVARKFNESKGKPAEMSYPVSKLSRLKNLLSDNDTAGARDEIKNLAATIPQGKLANAVHSSIFHPYVAAADDTEFRKSLSADDKKKIDAAEAERQVLWKRFNSLGVSGASRLSSSTPKPKPRFQLPALAKTQ